MPQSMLFNGISRKHSEKMCKFQLNQDFDALREYYLLNRETIRKSVFNDSYYSFKFWKVVAENIKRSHTMLPMILRKQYVGSEDVFCHLKNAYELTKTKNDSSLIKMITSLTEVHKPYVNEVYKFIIIPPLFRHHIYSPVMALYIFIDIMLSMCGQYIDSGIVSRGKQELSEYCIQDNGLNFLDDVNKMLIRDESDVHRVINLI